MNSESTYQYHHLAETNAIRLLVLQPSQDIKAKVQCALVHTTLSKSEDDLIEGYIALSYVWGDERVTKTISVDAKDFSVTVNLESALRHMRDPTRIQRIWADAICINQKDYKEKGQQVTQMGDVYRIAQHTVIYLGEATEESDRVLSFIKASDLTSLTTQSLSSVLERPWFTRIWVYQELLFSIDPWVQCGKLRVRWNQIYEGISTFVGAEKLVEPFKTFFSLGTQRKEFQNRPKQRNFCKELIDILEARRGLGVRDPRDMLYAHRGIVGGAAGNDEEKALVSVDYSRSVSQVYENLARYLFGMAIKDDLFRILSYNEAAPVDLEERCQDIASWAPNWSTKSLPYPYRRLNDAIDKLHRGIEDRHVGHLTYWQLANYFPAPSYTWVSPSVLSCVGVRIGAICKVSPVITSSQALWKLRPFLGGAVGEDTSNYFYHDRLLLCNHWRDILGPLLTGTDLHSLPPWAIDDPQYEQFAYYMSSEIAKLMRGTNHLVGRGGVLEKIRTSSTWLQNLGIILLMHAMTDSSATSDMDFPHFLYGRKFAVLDDDTLALVPGAAREGDVACTFVGNLKVPFVLRPKNVKKTTRRELEKTSHGQIGLGCYESYHTGHYDFVGECLVEKWMFGEKFQYFKDVWGYPKDINELKEPDHTDDGKSRRWVSIKDAFEGWMQRSSLDVQVFILY